MHLIPVPIKLQAEQVMIAVRILIKMAQRWISLRMTLAVLARVLAAASV
jgi:hypothetical protein